MGLSDRYVTPSNGDDSYARQYRAWLPAATLRYQARPNLAWHAAIAQGLETPTLNELAYRSGPGHFLQAARHASAELGLKARLGGGLMTAALFHTRVQSELVALSNAGGRANFHNAGRTRRRGFELSWQHESAGHWRTRLACTWLNVRYRDSFCSPAPCTPASRVPAGHMLPGVARHASYAAVGWQPPQGWRVGAELRAVSRVYANDANTAHAPAMHCRACMQATRAT